eukprot:GHVR01029794.1.p1 GENE.GHVR01029794.1~~GHVR01029794.1.p1  ORF type:complete len:168 (+),score=26.95 GHVR01029794.1:471-974(+)
MIVAYALTPITAHSLYNNTNDGFNAGTEAGLSLKFIANLFSFPSARRIIIDKHQQILKTLSSVSGSTIKGVRVGVASVLLNLSVAVKDMKEDFNQVITVCIEFLSTESDPEACYRLLATMCTLLISHRETSVAALSIGVEECLLGCATKFNEKRISDACDDVTLLLY